MFIFRARRAGRGRDWRGGRVVFPALGRRGGARDQRIREGQIHSGVFKLGVHVYIHRIYTQREYARMYKKMYILKQKQNKTPGGGYLYPEWSEES